MIDGLIIKILADLCYVKTNDGVFKCNSRGIFRKNNITPTVGDNVEIKILDSEKLLGFIEKIKPRSTYMIRPSISNVNKIILVVSCKKPKSDLVLLDKQIAFAHLNGIEPVICINKIDLDDEHFADAIESVYKNIGYTVIKTNAKELDSKQKLENIIQNSICVFSGNSGVGKSTLINAILGDNTMKEGKISEKISRGKHTTRHVELFEVADIGGYIADTPGFSTFDILDTPSNNLVNLFLEFADYIDDCEYRDCNHIKEQNCGIKNALSQGKIDNDRYKRFCTIYEELKSKELRKWN